MDKMKVIDGLMFPQVKRSAAEAKERIVRETIPDAARVIKDTWEKEAKKIDNLAFPKIKRSAAENMETLRRETIPNAIESLKDTIAKREGALISVRKDFDATMKSFEMLKNMMLKK